MEGCERLRATASSVSSSAGSVHSYERHLSNVHGSSFRLVEDKLVWRPPSRVLAAIVAAFPGRVPLAFAATHPAARFTIERTAGKGLVVHDYSVRPAGLTTAASPMFAWTTRTKARGSDGGVVEHDVVHSDSHREYGRPQRPVGFGGVNDYNGNSFLYACETASRHSGSDATSNSDASDNDRKATSDASSNETSCSSLLLSAGEHPGPSVHYYPSPGYHAAQAFLGKFPALGSAGGFSPVHRRSTDRLSHYNSNNITGDGHLRRDLDDCCDVSEASHVELELLLQEHRPHCLQTTRDELALCAVLECASHTAVLLAVHGAWWLSQYYGVSLRLSGMTQGTLNAFDVLRRYIVVKELICVHGVFNEAWLQCISTCPQLISVSLHGCTARNDVALRTVSSILNRPAVSTAEDIAATTTKAIVSSPLMATQSSAAASRTNQSTSTSQYLAGVRSLGSLSRLRCLHLSHSPFAANFLDYVAQCTALECLVLHKTRGLGSLDPLARLPRLQSLSLLNVAVTDEEVAALSRCRALRRLALESCRHVTQLRFLAGLQSSLRALALTRIACGDEDMTTYLAQCTQLTELHLCGLTRVTDYGCLAGLRALEALTIAEAALSLRSGRVLAALPQLTRLDLAGCRFVPLSPGGNVTFATTSSTTLANGKCGAARQEMAMTMVPHSAADAPPLLSLDLSRTNITRELAATMLGPCSQLRYLQLAECPQLSAVPFLTAWQQQQMRLVQSERWRSAVCSLRWISLQGSAVGDAEVQVLRVASHLRYISLRDCVAVATLEFVSSLRELEYVDLRNTAVTDAAVAALVRCTRLSYVNLSRCRYLTQAIALAALPRLRELNVAYTAVTAAGVPRSATLQVLLIHCCPMLVDLHPLLLPGVLPALCVLHADHISLPPSSPTHDTVDAPCTACSDCGSLVALSLRHSGLSDALLHGILRQTRLLTRLNVSECAAVKELPGLSSSLTQLRVLQAAHTSVNDAGVAEIGRCATLECVDLTNCVAISSVAALGALQALQTLHLSRTSVTNDAIADLARCLALRRLFLCDCRYVTNVNALHTLRLLRLLHLGGTGVTTKGTAKLARCTALEELYFTKCAQLTSVDALRQSLPKLRVLDVYGTAVPTRVTRLQQQLACAVIAMPLTVVTVQLIFALIGTRVPCEVTLHEPKTSPLGPTSCTTNSMSSSPLLSASHAPQSAAATIFSNNALSSHHLTPISTPAQLTVERLTRFLQRTVVQASVTNAAAAAAADEHASLSTPTGSLSARSIGNASVATTTSSAESVRPSKRAALLEFFDYYSLTPLQPRSVLADGGSVLLYCSTPVAFTLIEQLQLRWLRQGAPIDGGSPVGTSNVAVGDDEANEDNAHVELNAAPRLAREATPVTVGGSAAFSYATNNDDGHEQQQALTGQALAMDSAQRTTMLVCTHEERCVNLRRAVRALQQPLKLHYEQLLDDGRDATAAVSTQGATLQRLQDELTVSSSQGEGDDGDKRFADELPQLFGSLPCHAARHLTRPALRTALEACATAMAEARQFLAQADTAAAEARQLLAEENQFTQDFESLPLWQDPLAANPAALTLFQAEVERKLPAVRRIIAAMTRARLLLKQAKSRTSLVPPIAGRVALARQLPTALSRVEALLRRRVVLLRSARRLLRPLQLVRRELEAETEAMLRDESLAAVPHDVQSLLRHPIPALCTAEDDVTHFLDSLVLDHDVDGAEELLHSLGLQWDCDKPLAPCLPDEQGRSTQGQPSASPSVEPPTSDDT